MRERNISIHCSIINGLGLFNRTVLFAVHWLFRRHPTRTDDDCWSIVSGWRRWFENAEILDGNVHRRNSESIHSHASATSIRFRWRWWTMDSDFLLWCFLPLIRWRRTSPVDLSTALSNASRVLDLWPDVFSVADQRCRYLHVYHLRSTIDTTENRPDTGHHSLQLHGKRKLRTNTMHPAGSISSMLTGNIRSSWRHQRIPHCHILRVTGQTTRG